MMEMYNYTIYSMYTVVLINPEHCWSTIKVVNIVDKENIMCSTQNSFVFIYLYLNAVSQSCQNKLANMLGDQCIH